MTKDWKHLYVFMPLNEDNVPTKPPPRVSEPSYCTNPNCSQHQGFQAKNYIKKGTIRTAKYPFENQIFQCKKCHKKFSTNSFSMDYRKRIIGLSPLILDRRTNAETIRSIAKAVGLWEGSIRGRIKDLHRQAMIKENILAKDILIKESIAYDGFETFSGSQYSPCYINTAVGSDSLYTYSTTHSPLNRKGCMTKLQKYKNQKLYEKFGKYPHDSVRKETTYILQKLLSRTSKDCRLKFFTDCHKSYEASVKKDFTPDQIEHVQVSSKQRRDPSNPLFPINHLHLLKRHFNASQRRETIAFDKNEAGLMDTITLNRIHKNFFRAKFAKPNAFDPNAHTESPAMKIGIADRILKFYDFFEMRRSPNHANFDEKEWSAYNRDFEYSRLTIAS